uniref:Uncharacterized protein n=1 Tax=Rhizophora mucronata TaxID=61149 RepID=A0A2P2QV76_RHIMU
MAYVPSRHHTSLVLLILKFPSSNMCIISQQLKSYPKCN